MAKKYNLDEKVFIDHRTPTACYVMGLLWADGDLYFAKKGKTYSINLATTAPDFNHFVEHMKKLGTWGIYERKYKNENWKPGISVRATNENIFNYLCKFNYRQKILGVSELFDTWSHDEICYWIMGLIDGDGHIKCDEQRSNFRIDIAGHYNQNWEFLLNFCKRYNIVAKTNLVLMKKGRGSHFSIGGRREVTKFFNIVYKNNDLTLPLPRKLKPLQNIVQRGENMSSLTKGICFDKQTQKWIVYGFFEKGKRKFLGRKKSFEDAVALQTTFYKEMTN